MAFHSRTDHEPTGLWCDENIEMPEEQHDLYRPGHAAKGNQPPDYDGKDKRESPYERTCMVNTVEGNYCHMSDKTLWLVCAGEEVADDCFDKDPQVLRAEGLSARDSKYDEIMDWTADQPQGNRRGSSDLLLEEKLTWRQWLILSKRFLKHFSCKTLTG
ncbi:hypothetical protein DL768_011672 [Monosporascus sp. mg162]|nr:hypothetical protein DL768_011672 [Monosporascus sp. mg162]